MSDSTRYSIPVLKKSDLPKGEFFTTFYGVREFDSHVAPYSMYYECPHCGGWIEGYPDAVEEDDGEARVGRRGDGVSCARCGKELAFSGIIS